jgi:hypothetical protein
MLPHFPSSVQSQSNRDPLLPTNWLPSLEFLFLWETLTRLWERCADGSFMTHVTENLWPANCVRRRIKEL